MPQRWGLQMEDRFWDALIVLPGWPSSYYGVLKLLTDISEHADQGEEIPETAVRLAKANVTLPSDELLRLVIYYAIMDTHVVVLWVDDFDNPHDENDTWVFGSKQRLSH